MKLNNLGSELKKGKYFLHSKFKNVHNYSDNNSIISLVDTNIGNGPNNIVIDFVSNQAEKCIKISEESILIGNNILHYDRDKVVKYNALFLDNRLDLSTILFNLEDNLILKPKSLGFIIYPNHENNFETSFEKAFVKRVKENLQEFSLENLPQIAKKMKGLGFGLTPSGDDFNCGVLYGVHFLKKIIDIDFVSVVKKYYENSLGDNIISNTFLKYAYQNSYYQDFYKLLQSLKNNNKTDIIKYRNNVMNTGHSSGSDMLSGFLFYLKNMIPT